MDIPPDLMKWIMPEPNSGCWLWIGFRTSLGYGSVKRKQRVWAAHRWLYVCFHGDIPIGLELHHKCKTRSCVNLDHLQLLGRSEHRRLDQIGKPNPHRIRNPITHCKRGHPLSGTNLRVYRGLRHCVTCDNARSRAWWDARKNDPIIRSKAG